VIAPRIILAALLAQPLLPGAADAEREPKVSEATAAVEGPCVFTISVLSGDVAVKPGGKKEVKIRVTGAGARRPVALEQSGGKRVSARFAGQDFLRKGDVEVWLPPGSDVVIESVSGDVSVARVGGDARVEAVSGDVEVAGAAEVAIESVSGHVHVLGATDDVAVETVSGEVRVETNDREATRLRVDTTSGHVAWAGRCGAGCRIDVDTLSGSVELDAHAASSFDVDFDTFSGRHEGPSRVGKGVGTVDVATFSGTLSVRTRKP
jgi:hypothetical protein